MSDEVPLITATPIEPTEQQVVDVPLSVDVQTTLTSEEVRAVEAVFAQQDETRLVSGLLGLWTGTLLLHDLALEHLGPAVEEKRDRKREEEEDDPSR